jgi:hypothetical protein
MLEVGGWAGLDFFKISLEKTPAEKNYLSGTRKKFSRD